MSDTVPAAAVQIAKDALWAAPDFAPSTGARHALAALHKRGWLHDPAEVAQHEADLLAIEAQRADLAERLFAQEAEVATLRAVVEAAAEYMDVPWHAGGIDPKRDALRAALDALPSLDPRCPDCGKPIPGGEEEMDAHQREQHADLWADE